jgi:processive 1,2-diacylglycerol beta-glucosyltransferase
MEVSMFNRVLILSASAGAGHLRAAQAIEKAFKILNAAGDLRNIDTLDYTNKLFQKLYSKAYIELVDKAPDVLGWLYEHFDKPWHYQRRRLSFDKLNAGPFIKLLREYQPDLAVCTHFLPAEIISWLKEKHRLYTRQAIVVTDFDLHALWLCRHYEHYFVALEETKLHLQVLGTPPEKITVSGIPVDPVFAENKDKTEMRRKLGLDLALPAILISAGGFGVGPMEMLIESLTKMHNKVQVIAICGKNAELKNRLEKFSLKLFPKSTLRIIPVGYTTQMDEYMSAADLLLGKPGGLTTSEALAKALPIVIVRPIRGQEERNADHLLEEGAAIRCNNLPVLAYKIDKLLDDPRRMSQMRKNVRRLARPAAALNIVRKLLSLRNI